MPNKRALDNELVTLQIQVGFLSLQCLFWDAKYKTEPSMKCNCSVLTSAFLVAPFLSVQGSSLPLWPLFGVLWSIRPSQSKYCVVGRSADRLG